MPLYACNSCGSVTVDSSGCTVCGNATLEEVDVGEDEYVCEECGDTFDSNAGLNSHQRVHQDDEEE